jgi:hypothetical protein
LHSGKAYSAITRILIGPYGLHGFVAAVLALFLGFLWIFNFTTFFGQIDPEDTHPTN